MGRYDVFNGDADGICALQQLRLAEPADSILVTGVKRDISLLRRVHAAPGDQVTVLDVSLDKNRQDLQRLLAAGAAVLYVDHHYAGEVPQHPQLRLHIETDAHRGTSLAVDQLLAGRYRAWAVVGTFGDNFDASATAAAAPLGLDAAALAQLRDLGIYLNYNGYGAAVEDLHVPPDELFRRVQPYADPLAFVDQDPTFRQLESGYREDMAKAGQLQPEVVTPRRAVYILPAAPWARRVSGVLANELAQRTPTRAHALLTQLPGGGYVVSVRSPLDAAAAAAAGAADELCRAFPTGGGRRAAAGINQLPEDQLEAFLAAFAAAFG